MDIKQAGQLRQMEEHVFQKYEGPFVILAVHLCGTLSVKAVEMFNDHDAAATLCLKPCCLPEWSHTYTHEAWMVGDHCIPVADVCAKGKWKANRWIGPPRRHLREGARWVAHLHGRRRPGRREGLERIQIREEGGTRTRASLRSAEYATTPGAPRGRAAASRRDRARWTRRRRGGGGGGGGTFQGGEGRQGRRARASTRRRDERRSGMRRTTRRSGTRTRRRANRRECTCRARPIA